MNKKLRLHLQLRRCRRYGLLSLATAGLLVRNHQPDYFVIHLACTLD